MPVTARTLRLERDLRAQIEAITDAQTRDLVKAWVAAWDEVAPDLTATLLDMLTGGDRVTRTQMLRSTRLLKVLAVIADQLQDLADAAGVRITSDLAQVIALAGGAQASVIDSQLPPGAAQLVDLDAWSRVDADQVAAIVQRSTEQITALTRPLSADAYDVVRRELIRGVASGSNPRETARRMVARAEGGFNGGLTRALVIARTETLDAHRAAAALAQQQSEHADVLGAWVWLADLGPRTGPACFAMHGSRHDLTEPGPLGHQQCRCSRMPVTKTWKDLGFDIEEPPSLLPDASAFFDSLSPAEQRAILGPKRYDAWTRGEFPMDRWATRKSTDGWRDSFVVAQVPGARGGRRAA